MIRLSTHRLRTKSTLESIFGEEDVLGLLDVQPLKAKGEPRAPININFAEITAFYTRHAHLPEESSTVSLEEKILAKQLRSIREDPTQCALLQSQDKYGLLSDRDVDDGDPLQVAAERYPPDINNAERVTSLEDIFADDDEGLLAFSEPSIFNLQHVSTDKKTLPDEIAQRQPCADFPRFAPAFRALHDKLKEGTVGLARFTHKLKVTEGDFFILNGLVGYVASVGERLEQYSNYNARLHLVFENGTEMHMLYLSLTHGLVRDKEGSKVRLNGLTLSPSHEATPTGRVYILSTLSTDPALAAYKQSLYKIGFTKTSIEQRIRYAETDRTFLEAPVRIISDNACFNLNAQKLEALVHGFLAPRRLNIQLNDHMGQVYTPKEWFHVPLETALAVIKYIADGSISQYRLDNTTGKVLLK